MQRRPVLVTGTGGQSVGAGILYALTRARRAGACRERWEVIAADADPFAFGLYRTEKQTLLPLARDPQYLESLKKFIDKHGVVAVLPGTEVEAILLSGAADQLAPAQVVTNRHQMMGLMTDKRQLTARLSELRIDTPAACPAVMWRSFTEKHRFPVILKPAINTGGSRGVKIVVDEKTMRNLAQTIEHDLERFTLQEYVGSEGSEYTVGVLTDKSGKLIDSIVLRRKLIGLSLLERVAHEQREYAVSTGYSQGFIVNNARIQTFCERLALTLGSRGPLNIQLRVDGDRIVVFEVHPRFSGSTPIRADADFNEPDVLLRNFIDGEEFGRLGYRTNLVALRAFEHVLVPFEQYETVGGRVPLE